MTRLPCVGYTGQEERRKAQAEMATQLKQIQIEREASRRKLNAERGRFEEEKEVHRRRLVLVSTFEQVPRLTLRLMFGKEARSGYVGQIDR